MCAQSVGQRDRADGFRHTAFQVTDKECEGLLITVAVFRHIAVMVNINDIPDTHRIFLCGAGLTLFKFIALTFHFTDGVIHAGTGQPGEFRHRRF